MYSGVLSTIYFRYIAVVLAVLLVVPVSMVSALQSNTGGADFDIPISELNKVKKVTPTKRVAKKSRKKSSDTKALESSSKPAATAENAYQSHIQPVVPNDDVQIKAVAAQTPATADPIPESETVQIHHSPYSFVVAAKPTVIHAVISSKADILEVNCILRETEGGGQAQVKMEHVNGTLFTYTATLPGLSKEGSSLRYRIVVVDAQGKKIRSQEFATPVTSSPVVPSWQHEKAVEPIPAAKADGKKPLGP